LKVQGSDSSILIKTSHHEDNQRLYDVPYSEETIRDAVSLLQEEAAIEGDGVCKVIIKKCGVTGCIVTSLNIDTVPLLLFLAFGSAGNPLFVSETRNVYSCKLSLLPLEDTERFDLIQDRGIERRVYEQCSVNSFEFRFEREQNIKLKLDICGERYAAPYLYTDTFEKSTGERFNGNNVDYRINGKLNLNIYGLTLLVKKDKGIKSEIWIRRILENDNYLTESIEELQITARLLSSKYEYRSYGVFRITLKILKFISDETNVDSADTVLGSVRYFVNGSVEAEVFSKYENLL